MGCTDSRSDLSDVEMTLTTSEFLLRFHSAKVQQTDFVFRKFSSHGLVNSSQLAEALSSLSFKPKENLQVKAFYDSLSAAQGNISLKKLLIASILLGKGTDLEKAELLFEVFDDDNSRTLPESAIRGLVDDLYEVVVLHLPTLVPTSPSTEDTVKVQNYIEQIKFRGDRGREKLVLKLLDGKSAISVGNFKNFIVSLDNRSLMKTWGLRDFFFKVYKVTPASYNIERNPAQV